MGMPLDQVNHRRTLAPDIAMTTHPLRRRAAHFPCLAAMLRYPTEPIRDFPYSGDAVQTNGTEIGVINLPAFSRYRQQKIAGIRANIRLPFGIQGNHRQTCGHAFHQRQTKALTAQRKQYVGLAIPVHDTPGRLNLIHITDARIIGHVILIVVLGLDNQARIWIIGKSFLPRSDSRADVFPVIDGAHR